MKQNKEQVTEENETAKYDQLVDKRQKITKNEERDLVSEGKPSRC